MGDAVGFHASAVAHWESGRNACLLSVALQMADVSRPGTLEDLTEWITSDWAERVPPASPEGVALLLNDLLRQRNVGDVASTVGVSRSTLGRWLRAAGEPSLSQFLRFLDAVSLQETIVHLLAPTFSPDGARSPELSTCAREVGLALRLDRYRALPQHDRSWVARESGRSLAEIDDALRELQTLGAIEWSGTHWLVRRSPRFSFRRASPGAGPRGPNPRVRQLLHRGEYARGQVILANFTDQDLDRVKRILFDAGAEIKRIIQQSRPKGDRVAYVNLALLMLADQPVEEG